MKEKYKLRDTICNPIYHQYQLAENANYYRTRARKNTATFREKNPDKIKESHKKSEARIKKSGVYSCATCNVSCKASWELDRHNNSKRHLELVELLESGKKKKEKSATQKSAEKSLAAGRFVCKTCDVPCRSNWELSRHNESKRHLSKEAASGPSTSGSA
jgi:hypothetical protein